MQQAVIFNGYQITVRPGTSFPANVAGFGSSRFSLPEGIYATNVVVN